MGTISIFKKIIIFLITNKLIKYFVSENTKTILIDDFVKFYHDNTRFKYENGYLYESGGLYGKSILIKYKLGHREPKQRSLLDKNLFSEGITIVNDKIFQ
ncbi:hypothetical protein MHBO_002698, partial [Bonamia ostreae]